MDSKIKNPEPGRRLNSVFRKRTKATVSLLIALIMAVNLILDPLGVVVATRQAIFGAPDSYTTSPGAIDVIPPVTTPPAVEVTTEPPTPPPTTPPTTTPSATIPPSTTTSPPAIGVTTPPAIDPGIQSRIDYLLSVRNALLAELAFVNDQIANLQIPYEVTTESIAQFLQQQIAMLGSTIVSLFNQQFAATEQIEILEIMQTIAHYTTLLEETVTTLQALEDGTLTLFEMHDLALEARLQTLQSQREAILARIMEIDLELYLLGVVVTCPVWEQQIMDILYYYIPKYHYQILYHSNQINDFAERLLALSEAISEVYNQRQRRYDYHSALLYTLDEEFYLTANLVDVLGTEIRELTDYVVPAVIADGEMITFFDATLRYSVIGPDSILLTKLTQELYGLNIAMSELEELVEWFEYLRYGLLAPFRNESVTFVAAPANYGFVNGQATYGADVAFGESITFGNIPAITAAFDNVFGGGMVPTPVDSRIFLGWTQDYPIDFAAAGDATLASISQRLRSGDPVLIAAAQAEIALLPNTNGTVSAIGAAEIAAIEVTETGTYRFYANFWYVYHTVTFLTDLGDYGWHEPNAHFPLLPEYENDRNVHPLVVYRRHGTPISNFPSLVRPNYGRGTHSNDNMDFFCLSSFDRVSPFLNSTWAVCPGEFSTLAPIMLGTNCNCGSSPELCFRLLWDEGAQVFGETLFLVVSDIVLHTLWHISTHAIHFHTEGGGTLDGTALPGWEQLLGPNVANNFQQRIVPRSTVTLERIPVPVANPGYRFSHWVREEIPATPVVNANPARNLVTGPCGCDDGDPCNSVCKCVSTCEEVECECECECDGFCRCRECVASYVVPMHVATTVFIAIFVPDFTLTVSKELSGVFADPDQDYNFTIYFRTWCDEASDYIPLNVGGTIQQTVRLTSSPYTVISTSPTTLVNGRATFTLYHGQSIVFEGLPSNAVVRIVENVDTELYIVTIEYLGGSDPIENNETSAAGSYRPVLPVGEGYAQQDMYFIFNNYLDIGPPTGVNIANTGIAVMFFGATMVSAAAVFVGIMRRRRFM